MLPPSPHSTTSGVSFEVIELGFSLIAVASAFCWPRAGSRWFSTLERLFGRLARRRKLSVFVIGFTALAARLAILPLSPIPEPFVHDDFSFLLAGETFASGRLTNPTPPMWMHFESFHITMKPTYMSMYFPAQGMVLAAGKVVTGNVWFGVLAASALMCAAICWMLQAWLPPGWALFGGALAIVRLSLFSYWIDTYSGGGAIAAIGGAFVLGALPRFLRSAKIRDGMWMALGAAILANSRPYEGLLLCLPVAFTLCWWVVKKRSPSLPVLFLRMAAPAALLLVTVAGMAYYNYRVFGNMFTPPYAINRATYASAEHFLWQSPRPVPVYRHEVMREFYTDIELATFLRQKTIPGYFEVAAYKLGVMTLFFFGTTLIPPLIMLPWSLRDRRIRLLVTIGAVLAVGLAIETWFIPHYLAPFTAGLYVILLQSMRHLRAWRPGGQPAGLMLVRMIPVVCLVLVAARLYAAPLKLDLGRFREINWYGSEPEGARRARTLAKLESYRGSQLAIVRYAPDHNFFEEWVYNSPDIDKSRVVWARDMGAVANQELLRYFHNRTVWLVQPDFDPPRISPYPSMEQLEPAEQTRFTKPPSLNLQRATP
jgi:hypothetical protein